LETDKIEFDISLVGSESDKHTSIFYDKTYIRRFSNSLFNLYIDPYIVGYLREIGFDVTRITKSDSTNINVKFTVFPLPYNFPLPTDLTITPNNYDEYDIDNKDFNINIISNNISEVIPVNSNILYYNGGEYFTNLLSNKLEKVNEVNLDYSVDAVEAFVEFIYTGKISTDPDYEELYYLSRYLNNESLYHYVLNHFYYNLDNIQMIYNVNDDIYLDRIIKILMTL
jgi:hypothetical protein